MTQTRGYETYLGLRVVGIIKDKDYQGDFVELRLAVGEMKMPEILSFLSTVPQKVYFDSEEYSLAAFRFNPVDREITLLHHK